MSNALEIAQKLIACPSVTPLDEGAQQYLSALLTGMGFTCHHLPFAEVPNLFARIGTSGPHFCYAGHTDVVPPGPLDKWSHAPFSPVVRDGALYGRGAADMKGSIAAFIAAADTYLKIQERPPGSISLLITGDEEGPSVNGTAKVLEWMKQHGHIPDVCLVGEPTNPRHLGQEIKIGRRGSLSGVISVEGKQGHVAYPALADNPVPRLVRLLHALDAATLDSGSEYFQPTNLEITSIDVGNPATNVIPAQAKALFNVRFNDRWTAATLEGALRKVLDEAGEAYRLETSSSAESFMTKPGDFTDLVQKAVLEITGHKAALTTTGGTSDARFVTRYCPVVEFGPVNASIHQIDENIEVRVLEDLTRVYERVLALFFKQR